ncbi:leucine-rich repeat transmembrane neuronal protein 4-like [Uranotaenia lowii]|uniref:leucine-rich repeat transmembrane neuronal protein 4-like n=1 Tax=Uranotaenia lowii TaxID=190385 RepID=UPI00247A4BDC|nr:leucine-rich repeat transmembrane neuronal protein 4-like [Uranotaenia lowii]
MKPFWTFLVLIGCFEAVKLSPCAEIGHSSEIFRNDPMACAVLDLDQGNFTHVNSSAFGEDQENLELINAILWQFGSDQFEMLPASIKYLTISYGNVSEVFFVSEKLISLAVLESNLESFVVMNQNNSELKSLTLRSRLLNEVPSELGYLQSLEVLRLSNCNLSSVNADSFLMLVNLTFLDLSDNRIVSFEIVPTAKFLRLKELQIEENELTEIDHFPEAFPKLKTLSLFDNRWFCDWVGKVRRKIWKANIVVYGSNAQCAATGGLCCVKRSKQEVIEPLKL